ncbi:hypothetical protein BV898_17049 [Hypsibius exemplaris]|uniref:G-protein coupled receptors family 1 profile domain-containing protein n=1 Tax=Hypsibius exemplaris TaxID=2072580 RepID=A0A9X6NEU6_HYPEX|nr:hypothetical protein BV898_17049 [Hypsibius exemplaris]
MEYFGTALLLNLLCISVDRWLSIDFATQYHHLISKRRVRAVIIVMAFVALLLKVPGFIVYWQSFAAYCDWPLTKVGFTVAQQAWTILTVPAIVGVRVC